MEEVPAWVEALDEEASLALFERALFDRELLEQALSGRANLRDALLTAYITRQ